MGFEYLVEGLMVRLFEAEQAEVGPGVRVLQPRDERVMPIPQLARPHFD